MVAYLGPCSVARRGSHKVGTCSWGCGALVWDDAGLGARGGNDRNVNKFGGVEGHDVQE